MNWSAYQLGKEAAFKDYAPGLPAKTNFGDIESLKPGMVTDFVVQVHDAERAGKHRDVRLGTKATGLLSWATKKELPAPGKTIALFRQPVHRHSYGKFEGTIEDGYGKGKVTLEDAGKLLLTRVSPRSLQFSRIDRRGIERFRMVRPEEGKPWMLTNVTPTERPPHDKEHYKLKRELGALPAGAVVQPKVDGASVLVTVKAPNKIELTSFRMSKGTGYPIVHTERVLDPAKKLDLPKSLVGSVLRGEIYGVRDGRAIPPAELSGILNSTVENALVAQKNVKLKTMLFDVRKAEGKDVSKLPYKERLEQLRAFVKHFPASVFHVPETATTQAAADKMLADIKAGKNPLTREGVVVHAPEHAASRKVKLTDEHDVFIKEIFAGEGKHKGRAGGFTYSMKKNGPEVGRVGTGFPDALRKELWDAKEEYKGRRARVQAQEVLPSGALRAPVLISLHEG